MKRIDIVVNSVHGNTPLIQELLHLSKNCGIEVNVYNTNYQGHASILAEQLCQQNPTLLIAVGGDGTAHEVINGMLKNENQLPFFTIVPVGTGNDFMRRRETFQSAAQLIDSLDNSKIRATDLGCISHAQQKSYFLNIADTGFGGATVHTLNKQRKWLGGKISYSIAILRTFISYRKPHLRISNDAWSHEGKVLLCAFCNGGIFGSGLTINPSADPHDGQLDMTLIGNVSLFDYIRYLPKLKKGTPIHHNEVKYLRSNKFYVQVRSGRSSTEADGEPICESDFEVELLPGKINLLIP